MKNVLINAIVVVMIGVVGYGLLEMMQKGRELSADMERLQARIASLEGENEQLEADLEYFSHPENLEKEARARGNLKKPDERLIILTRRPGEDGADILEEEATSEEEADSPWQKIKNFFFSSP